MTDYSTATQYSDLLTRAWLGDLPHRYTISRQRAWKPSIEWNRPQAALVDALPGCAVTAA